MGTKSDKKIPIKKGNCCEGDCADVCKECVEKNHGEFMDAKFDLQEALDWFHLDVMHLNMDILDGEDIGDKLEQFKSACTKIKEIADEFSCGKTIK